MPEHSYNTWPQRPPENWPYILHWLYICGPYKWDVLYPLITNDRGPRQTSTCLVVDARNGSPISDPGKLCQTPSEIVHFHESQGISG